MNTPAPRYFVSDKYGLLRTDIAEPGYGRPVTPEQVIRTAAARAAGGRRK